MSEQTKPGATGWRGVFLGTAGGTGLFLLYQFCNALWRLGSSTSEMDNKFSQLAREQHIAYFVSQNLWVLVGYLILWIAAILLIYPLTTILAKRLRWRGRGSVAIPALILTILLHGYFMMRLIHGRPYFLGNFPSAGWYQGLLELPPESLRPAISGFLFGIFPWAALAGVAGWWLFRFKAKTRALILTLGLLTTAALAFSPGRRKAAPKETSSGPKPMNVIVIGSDSLRGDRLGYTGYTPERKDGPAAAGVSPHIDEWAKDAVRFSKCYVPMGSTLESCTAMMTSSYPHTNGIRHMYPAQSQVKATAASMRPIASVLNEKGYDTAAIGDWCASFYEMMPLGFRDISVSSYDNFRIYMSQAVLMAHFVVPLYFDNPVGYKIFPQIGSFAQFVTPEVVTKRVEDKLAEQAASGRPFFWHVFYSCNHLPYRCAEPFNRMFADPDYKGMHEHGVAFDINSFVKGTDMEDKLKALSDADIRQIRALYDGCTRQFDTCFARIREALRKNGMEENTIVVVTADHGDDLYEPGVTITHGLGFNGGDHSFHIPLAIHAPGIDSASIPEQVRSIDIAPTLLDLLDIERPAQWEGKSLAGWMRGSETRYDRPYYGETSFPFILFKVPGMERPKLPGMEDLIRIEPEYNYNFVMKPEFEHPVAESKQRCLRTRNWKVVCTPASDGSRHFGLFRIADDPDSRNDLAEDMPQILAPLRAALERWIDRHEETPIAEIFPQGEP